MWRQRLLCRHISFRHQTPVIARERAASRCGRIAPMSAQSNNSHPPSSRRSHSHTQTSKRTTSKRTAPANFTPAQLDARRASVPHIVYPDLPVASRRTDIARAIEANQVVIVAGETGSGKTTQLPKICLELGRGITGLIGHTQPRRIAARSVAQRISDELHVELGSVVGYQVRFTDETSNHTLVKLMTDGILLAEIQSDPLLLRYDTLIIDEAHERSLNIDFLLGYLARLLPQRPDLKLIITSATIDTDRFARHFGPRMAGGTPDTLAPVIEVSGRTYPVEIRYRPLERIDDAPPAATGKPTQPATPGRVEAIDQVTGIMEAAEELMGEGPGDILVFLSGEGEIRDVAAAFAEELGPRYIEPSGRSNVPDSVEVLPLYARLSAAEQHRIFAAHPHRRIILATNIAETSLTVPGIRYVIDAGTARISRYSAKTKVQRLPIEPVSQASANQRAGRCGRVANGICIRLYSPEDFASRDEFTQPEIQRTSLASVILQMLSLGLGDVDAFPFIDPPDSRAVRAGMQLLEEIGAIDTRPRHRGSRAGGSPTPRLTRIGWKLARLPIDPRLGRMLIEADKNGCASEVLVLVAALSVQDVRERPAEKRAQADQLHARFTAQNSDFLAYLTLWRYLRTQARDLSGSAFRRMCHGEFLNHLRYREWVDVVRQLDQMARPLGLDTHPLALPTEAQVQAASHDADQHLGAHPRSAAAAAACRELGRSADTPSADAIHRSLLVGLLSNLGSYQQRTRDFEGARGTHFVIWPGSGLHRRTPEWVMAAELVETSRLFARTVAAIEGDWIEAAARRLVRRSYSEPYWSRRMGAAMCTEKVTLYGMTLVADRPVLLSKAGAAEARELARSMFIENALVRGDWRGHHAFLERNAQALEAARESERRLRAHGLVADEGKLAAFYDERLPASIVSAGHFDSWWKKERAAGRGSSLDFTEDFLLGSTRVDEEDFPGVWRQGDLELNLVYAFNPGGYGDGVTVEIPVTVLGHVKAEGFDWLVPGMRSDLILGTIRALPKRVRRQLVPAPDVARELEPLIANVEAHGAPDMNETEGGAPVAPEDKAATARRESALAVEAKARLRGDVFDKLALALAAEEVSAEQEEEAEQSPAVPASPSAHPLSFREAFTLAVRQARGITITDEDWAEVHVPEHLTMHFRVLSQRGAVLDESTSLEQLHARLSSESASAVASVVRGAVAQALDEAGQLPAHDEAQSATQGDGAHTSPSSTADEGLTTALCASVEHTPVGEALDDFPQATIPAVVQARGPHGPVRGYPALALADTSHPADLHYGLPCRADTHRHASFSESEPVVRLEIFPSASEQALAHEQAVRELAYRRLRLDTARISSRWNGAQALALASAPYPSTRALVADLQRVAASVVCEAWSDEVEIDVSSVRSREDFEALCTWGRDRFEDDVYAASVLVAEICTQREQALRAVEATRSVALLGAASDERNHIEQLAGAGFVAATPISQLRHFPRYLTASRLRLEKAAGNPGGDDAAAWQIHQAQALIEEACEEAANLPFDATRVARIERAYWLIEEFRVSLFAQQLGTAEKVSAKRIARALSQ